MKTEIWDMRNYQESPLDYPELENIKQVYNDGGLIAIPTETVYGLGADARNQHAVSNIYQAKGRPSDNPLIVHIHDKSQLDQIISHLPEEAKCLMDEFWPGPISFILPLRQGYLCEKVTGGLQSIAVRMPSHPIGRAILQYIDMPIAAPSANVSGRPSPTTFQHVFNDLNGKIDGIVNGDQSEEGLESTVLDCTQFPFRIARPGSITQAMLNDVLPGSVEDYHYDVSSQPIAPGMKYKHYAPDIPVTMLTHLSEPIKTIKEWSNTAFILPETLKQYAPSDALFIKLCKDEKDIRQANHNLYQILHSIDENPSIDQAYIYAFDKTDESEAIMNRIIKATGNHIVRGENL
ncbi:MULTISPECIES: L-threonylcarbamoyladenylate synthase [Staphylococcus]|nr:MULTISPECIES: L-threonylcarbamoyladenylate synthase [Staphylococcus]MCH4336975.1 threonylcarbamoyl-AMP synthase [Staphylococcus haemolyticus]OLF64038.1 threonylcarbamoyl-AMP synthase [Staphylococcus sp. MB377]PNH23150.1 threonylcarbamoyl-AMP synthase [Staphylococcus haemolyticus]QTK08771.1 threonylcarbamoyl-AMP synthase [Staphylococcus haemolyticus]QTK10934.1 threonylcarbamoyl-AMP synthase [Staphylococcus haemolyticus]